MRRILNLVVLALGLVAVALVSAVGAMRLGIHGSEVRIPKLVGLSPAEAERISIANGLIVVRESKFYSAEIPPGKIMNQIPAPGSKVRRGWRIRVAESLGPQRAVIPAVLGQSARAAEIDIRRRGLELGRKATLSLPSAAADQVLAQSPPPNTEEIASPKVDLLLASPAPAQEFVMPNLVGSRLSDAAAKIQAAGMTLGRVYEVRATSPVPVPVLQDPVAGVAESTEAPVPPPIPTMRAVIGVSTTPLALIIHQTPPAGQKIPLQTVISLAVGR